MLPLPFSTRLQVLRKVTWGMCLSNFCVLKIALDLTVCQHQIDSMQYTQISPCCA